MTMKLMEWERQARANGHKLLGWGERDSQRSKVYKAESVLKFGPALGQVGIVALVRKVESSPYVIKNFGAQVHKVEVKRADATWSHAYRTGKMRFSPQANEYIVIHELAHTYSRNDNGGHGWLFCAVLLDLVRHFMGQEAHDKLKASFKAHGVKFTVPRAKRQMSPEARAAASERMAAARAARLGSVVEPHCFVVRSTDWHGNLLDHYVLVERIDKYNYPTITPMLMGRSGSTPYLVRSSDKGIATMFDRLQRWLPNRVTAVPVSKLPQGRSILPGDWKP